MSISIAECRAAGVVFEADEAVAIAQQLITSLRNPGNTDEVESPFGPPSATNVFLHEDGSVICRGCRMTPVVSEIAIFLEDLLPDGSARVPGALEQCGCPATPSSSLSSSTVLKGVGRWVLNCAH